MGTPLRVLVLEDSEDDYLILIRTLRRGGFELKSTRVESKNGMEEALREETWDCIISDYYMPQFNALDGLAIKNKRGLDLPFIVISGTIGEELAVSAMRAGANDYLMKDNLQRLVPAINRELGEARMREENRLARKQQCLSISILRLLNDSRGEPDTVRKLLSMIKEFTDFDAAAIRLKKGDDFPYFETVGFRNSFVTAEKHLCHRDKTGQPTLNARGKPVLACICGEVASGRTNPSEPFFTEGGSFWTNSMTQVFSFPWIREHHYSMRDQCHGAGYESVALIPLQFQEKTIGILQLNDSRKDRLTESSIRFFEGLGNSIGIALGQLQVKNKIEEREKYYRTLLHTLHEEIMVVDKTYGITDVNNNLLITSGLTREEIIGRKCHEVSHGLPHPCHHEAHGCGLARVVETGTASRCVHEHLDARGERTWTDILYSPLKDSMGNITHVIKAIRDVSDLKRAENEMRIKDKAISSAVSGIALIDMAGNLTYANSSFCQLWGYGCAEEIAGVSYASFWRNPEDAASALTTVRSNGAWHGEMIARRKDGGTFDALVSSNMVLDDSETPMCLMGSFLNITETKRLAERLRQAQKMEAIGTLAGGISHDFNNILSAIIGFGELALFKLKKGTDLYENISEVLRGGHRAKRLVRQILTFSRRSEKEFSPVDMDLVIREALKLLSSTLPSTIEIKQEFDHDIGMVMGDSTEIHQIIMNLCTNAAHAMRGRNGILRISLKSVVMDKDFATQHPSLSPGAYLWLTVSDTGCGMSPDVMRQIFNPYYTTKEKGEGTGMGLSVVQGIVNDYGGEITVYSEPDKGTVFHIYLPQIQEETTCEQCREEAIPAGHERILFVDDEPTLTKLVGQVLGRLGYQVTALTGSMEALEAFRATPDHFDLVITDMTMPNMTGDILAGELVKIRPNLPVILCSGFIDRITEEKAKASGIRGFLLKPIVTRDLSRSIRELLDK